VKGVDVLNPALTEMVAQDRIRELQAAAAKRSSPVRPPVSTHTAAKRSSPVRVQTAAQRPLLVRPFGRSETAAHQPSSRAIRHAHLANPRRAIGWFLVSVGLRLALPRARTGSVR
jgi:hypothetical protein